MASTRNKNTSGDNCLEETKNKNSRNYTLYKHSQYGEAYHTKIAGNGLNPGQMPVNTLSQNSADIESFLFGINSSNLVSPAENLTPRLNDLQSQHLYKKSTVFIPEPLIIEKNQRPYRM